MSYVEAFANEHAAIILVTLALIVLLSGIAAYLNNQKYKQEFDKIKDGPRKSLCGLGNVAGWESVVKSEIVDMDAELKFLVNPVKATPKKLTKKQAKRLRAKRARKSRKLSK